MEYDVFVVQGSMTGDIHLEFVGISKQPNEKHFCFFSLVFWGEQKVCTESPHRVQETLRANDISKSSTISHGVRSQL